MTGNPQHNPPPEDKPRIEALVASCIEALERGEPDPATRVCSERPDLLLRVRRRLAQLASRGLIPGADELPSSIGPYRILRELGSGGMGHVYLAEQTEPVRRHVALKVIKLGMDTREVVARFQAERQALALMNHPHIAQVFDAGITNEGRPFFAMEYVGGTMLTSFCDRRALATVPRVRLMATVCRAVQHAHDRGFIHRDLKPSNVLITEHEGEFLPKVIDFGIAKATAAASGNAATQIASMHTRADQLLGTPEYMSPEQLCSGGLDVDTRTDVYSLGVTLYELLCGELPFDSERLRRAPRSELEHILQHELPTGPSRRLSLAADAIVAARGGERTTVLRAVAGELDWITLKALAKNRDHRYPSALALAEDLERWLRHEPVLAAPPGRGYRLRKFVRRHRVAVTASAAVLVSLVAGLLISLKATSDARDALAREEAALDDTRSFYRLARDAVGNLVDVADARLAEVAQADAVRRQMLADAIAFYEQLRARQPQDPDLRADMLQATQRIGTLQRRLGQTTDALATLQRCVADVEMLRAARPTDTRVLLLATIAGQELAQTYAVLGRGGDAKQALQQALAHFEALRSSTPEGSPLLDVNEARLVANLAIETDDDVPAALALYERSLAAWDRVTTRGPATEREHAQCVAKYATALTRSNRLDDAAAALTTAIERLRALPPASGTAVREDEATVQELFSNVLRRLKRYAEARTARQRAVALFAELAREHPEVPAHADNEAAGMHFLAQLDQDEAKPRDALANITRAVEIRERLAAAHPQDHRLATFCVRSLLTKGDIELSLWQHHGGDKAVATATIARAIELVDALHAAHGDDLDVVITFAAVHAARAAAATTERRFADAREEHLAVRTALAAKLDQFGTNANLHYQLACVGNNLVQANFLLRQFDEARAAGEQGLVHLEKGLALDARHRALLELVPTLIGRLAAAYFADADAPAAMAALLRLCEHAEWGADAKEQGCLLLAENLGRMGEEAQGYAAWAERAITELRSAIAARGDVAAALARPPQRDGFSHTGSRLRDFDLRLALGDLLGDGKQFEEQERVLAEAVQMYESLPGLAGGRVRNLHAQRAELALQQGRPADAAAAADALIERVGADGGANYLVAVLYAKSGEGIVDAAAKETLAGKAVECLGRAIEKREVKPDAAAHPNFASLRGRADYDALLAK